ncbi:arginine-tRNA-protein transferase [Hymenobacter sp. BT770]|uniref:arginine-tRNA-protein transferase n=1 Tax=Hymenobacter sp. BT770 TaxID=2886942 RepID=UPI001D0FC7F7|nr:arginine-tRNA-protein transferase [Hymenobacter sp. BT770]MCC3153453.1 arginine-tRNA-protein transferase [Hymenobacter sp. BT770]MDO3415465.1 arginine-tRNA-protein transferase [Hymenobacter sp. BT770]
MSASSSGLPVIRGEALDYYLGLGYYRMQQDLFTCQFVPFNGRIYTAHWLRVVLPRVEWGAEPRRLIRRNARFAASIQPFRLTAEHEELYARYRSAITFDASSTVEAVLLGGAEHNVFNTYIIELRDGHRLVAAGIFDRGDRSVAGILNFYDPAYRQHSLGKYLLLLKTDYARRLDLDYYYPGYVVHDYPKFDYKLSLSAAATEVFDSVRGRWQTYSRAAVTAHSVELLADWLPEGLRELAEKLTGLTE